MTVSPTASPAGPPSSSSLPAPASCHLMSPGSPDDSSSTFSMILRAQHRYLRTCAGAQVIQASYSNTVADTKDML